MIGYSPDPVGLQIRAGQNGEDARHLARASRIDGNDSGVGVRLIREGRTSFAYGNDLSPGAIMEMAVQIVKEDQSSLPRVALVFDDSLAAQEPASRGLAAATSLSRPRPAVRAQLEGPRGTW